MNNIAFALLGLGSFVTMACSQGADINEVGNYAPEEVVNGESINNGGPSSEMLDAEEAAVQVDVLHELNAGSDRLSILRTKAPDGEDLLFMTVDSSVAFKQGTLARLREQEPALTLLEIFMAVSPEGSVADPALVAFHEEQTNTMGRADTAVRHVDFDVNAPVEKSGSSDCTAWAEQHAAALQGADFIKSYTGFDISVGNASVCPTSNCNQFHNDGQWVGMCVTGSVSRAGKIWLRNQGSSWQSQGPGVVIQPGMTRWAYLPGSILHARVIAMEISHVGNGVPFPAPASARGWLAL